MRTSWNDGDRYSGQSDVPTLTGHGIHQAYQLARVLEESRLVSKIVCSDLRRAQQTALILAGPYGLEPVVDLRLRELAIGHMDGMGAAARAVFADPYLSTHHPNYNFTSIGGESREQVIRRHQEAFDEHVTDEGICLFVGHGTSLRTFLESCGVTEPIVQGGFVQLLYRKTEA